MAFGLSRRKAVLLLFYGAPVVLLHCLDYVSQQMTMADPAWSRDLDVFEMFSGCGELSKQCRASGLHVRRYDLERGPMFDFTTPQGFFLALKNTLRVRHNGLLWCGVPCSSWVWISMATTKRTMPGHGIMGDPGLECVECANTIAARTALLVMVALIRGIWWAAEQPGSSVLKDTPYLSHVLTSMGPSFLRRMWMGNFDHFAPKPSMLFGSWPSIEDFQSHLPQHIRRMLQQNSEGICLCAGKCSSQGIERTRGL